MRTRVTLTVRLVTRVTRVTRVDIPKTLQGSSFAKSNRFGPRCPGAELVLGQNDWEPPG